MPIKVTTKSFINKAITIHQGKFSYDKVSYINNKTKVTITCPIHGDFEQTPSDHLQGKGCIGCKNDKLSKERRKTSKEFVTDAKEIHKEKYDYSLVKYTKSTGKVRYDTAFDADAALATLARTSKRDKKPIRKYKCSFCGGFHLTSKTRRK